MLQMDDTMMIRRMHFAKKWGIRRIVRETGFSRQTVRKVLRGEHGGYRMGGQRAKPVIGEHMDAIAELLLKEKKDKTRRKQRLTGHRIYKLLRKQGYTGSESTVRRAVREVRIAHGLLTKEAFISLVYEPGVDGQVDFFEADVRLCGEVLTLTFLLLRACYSSRTFVARVPAENQESLFEALIRGFEYFGGVFHSLWFDNLTPVVAKVLSGRARKVQRNFADFRAHYSFEAEFCAPSKGNEKGGVENGVEYVRQNALSPVPEVQDLAEVGQMLNEFMSEEEERKPARRSATIIEAWAEEAPVLLPLPSARFDVGRPLSRKVDSRALISVNTNLYSVPVALVGRRVLVKSYAERLEIHSSQELVAQHARLYGRNGSSLQLAHYLPLLEQKVRAFDHAAPVKAVRDEWPPCYETLLRLLRKREGDANGTREFIQVLYLHEDRPKEIVRRAVESALTHAAPSAAAVLAYLDLQKREANPPETIGEETLRRFPDVGVEPGDVAQYDTLLQERAQ